MKKLYLVIGIVIILALVSLPGAAMINKADLMASYPVPRFADFYFDDGNFKRPESYNCCSDTFGRHLNYTIMDTVTPTPTPIPTPVPYDSADDSDCDECREPGVYCGCDHGPSSGGVPVFITPLTPTVEGSMKLTERHIPQLPPYMPSWVTIGFY